MSGDRPAQGWMMRTVGSLLDWSPAGKCLLVACWVLAAIMSYGVCGFYVRAHPNVAPYVDQGFLATAFPIIFWGTIIGWAAVALAALWLQNRAPQSSVLVDVTVNWLSVTFAVVSYAFGHFTNLFTGTVGTGALAVGLILFERPAMMRAIGLAIFLLAGTTVAEQMGVIPYAPLLVHEPWSEGRLAGSWLIGFGGTSFVLFLAYVPHLVEVVERWRDREARLAATSEQLARANDHISRYVARQLVEQIRAGNYDVAERHRRRKLTLFFSDVKDFAGIVDQSEPEDLSEVLNEYLSEMTSIAERYGGTIDKFVGDAIMIFFGAPLSTDDRENAHRAVQMAVEMQRRLIALRDKWKRAGFARPFDVRMGINTGQATIGNFGSQSRMDYTAIGRQVNLAARLETACEPGRILISHSTWVLVQDEIECIPKGEIQVKGFRDAVKVYEVAQGIPDARRPVRSERA